MLLLVQETWIGPDDEDFMFEIFADSNLETIWQGEWFECDDPKAREEAEEVLLAVIVALTKVGAVVMSELPR